MIGPCVVTRHDVGIVDEAHEVRIADVGDVAACTVAVDRDHEVGVAEA